MRFLSNPIFLIMAAVGSFCGGHSLNAVGVGREMGPFCLQVQGVTNTNRAVTIDNPVCYAMQSKKVLMLTVQIDEAINNQQFMNYTKKLTVEPYLYGIDRNQQPVLCGNILRNEILSQGNSQYGFTQNAYNSIPSLFTGMVSWVGNQTENSPVNVWKVLSVEVNQSAAFFPKADIMQLFGNRGVNTICSVLPVPATVQQPYGAQQTYTPQYQSATQNPSYTAPQTSTPQYQGSTQYQGSKQTPSYIVPQVPASQYQGATQFQGSTQYPTTTQYPTNSQY